MDKASHWSSEGYMLYTYVTSAISVYVNLKGQYKMAQMRFFIILNVCQVTAAQIIIINKIKT